MTTIGYGDVVPVTTDEKKFCVVGAIIGAMQVSGGNQFHSASEYQVKPLHSRIAVMYTNSQHEVCFFFNDYVLSHQFFSRTATQLGGVCEI